MMKSRLGAISTTALLAIAGIGGVVAGGTMMVTGVTPCSLMAACDTGAKATTVSNTEKAGCPVSGQATTVANSAGDCATKTACEGQATTVANTDTKAADSCCPLTSGRATVVAAKAEGDCATKTACAGQATTVAAKADGCCAGQATTVAAKAEGACTTKTECTGQATTVAASAVCTEKKATCTTQWVEMVSACGAKQNVRYVMLGGRMPTIIAAAAMAAPVATPVNNTAAAAEACTPEHCSKEAACSDPNAATCSKGDECCKAKAAAAAKAVPTAAGS